MTLNCWTFKWIVCAIALVSFAAGSRITARLMQINQVEADSNRVFGLRGYHTVPDTVPEMESRFRNTTSKILPKHDLKAVGYCVPEGGPDWDDMFIFIVANSSRAEAKNNWDAFRADPEFQEVLKTKQADKTAGKMDEMYMRPTDFSPMR